MNELKRRRRSKGREEEEEEEGKRAENFRMRRGENTTKTYLKRR